jgi:hypothetical protein
MIARFRALLPYSIYVPLGEDLKPIVARRDEMDIIFYPPMQAQRVVMTAGNPLFLDQLGEGLIPLEKPQSSPDNIFNGSETFQCNLIQLDFKQKDFKRMVGQPFEPPMDRIVDAANSLILRFRSVAQASYARPLDTAPSPWALEYLTDDGSSLQLEEGKFRKRHGTFFKMNVAALTTEVWKKIESLPVEYNPAAYDRLLLDAEASLPDLGPAIVLAFSALETLISASLAVLIRQSKGNAELWEWIQSREGDYRKEPSVSEEFDVLLKALSGSSLRDNQDLWQAFQRLRDARNNFIHSGVLAFGKKVKTPLLTKDVNELLGKTKEIVLFVENLLPESSRRPVQFGKYEWTHTQMIRLAGPEIEVIPKDAPSPSSPDEG